MVLISAVVLCLQLEGISETKIHQSLIYFKDIM